jgi:carboxymethylenebutenolidase
MKMVEFIEIPQEDSASDSGKLRQRAYLARPKKGGGPALLILPEVFNINGWGRGVADRCADAGLTAVVPDIFWRVESGLDLPYTEEGLLKGLALYASLDIVQAIKDSRHIVDWLRALPDNNGEVGIIGFCLGGQIAFLAGAQDVGDAIVSYYGTELEQHLHHVSALRIPTVLHFGEIDERVPAWIAEAIQSRLEPDQPVSAHVYAAADHGFARFGHLPYRHDAVESALARNIELFRLNPGLIA